MDPAAHDQDTVQYLEGHRTVSLSTQLTRQMSSIGRFPRHNLGRDPLPSAERERFAIPQIAMSLAILERGLYPARDWG